MYYCAEKSRNMKKHRASTIFVENLAVVLKKTFKFECVILQFSYCAKRRYIYYIFILKITIGFRLKFSYNRQQILVDYKTRIHDLIINNKRPM